MRRAPLASTRAISQHTPNWVRDRTPLGWCRPCSGQWSPCGALLFLQARRMMIRHRRAAGRNVPWRGPRDALQRQAEPAGSRGTSAGVSTPRLLPGRFTLTPMAPSAGPPPVRAEPSPPPRWRCASGKRKDTERLQAAQARMRDRESFAAIEAEPSRVRCARLFESVVPLGRPLALKIGLDTRWEASVARSGGLEPLPQMLAVARVRDAAAGSKPGTHAAAEAPADCLAPASIYHPAVRLP